MIRIIREDREARGVTDGTRKVEQSDAHEPPPRVSVPVLRNSWVLDWLPTPDAGPVTNTKRGTAFHVPVPDKTKLTGFVMCEQMKSIDYRARGAKRIGTAPRAFFEEVLGVIDACIYPKPEPGG